LCGIASKLLCLSRRIGRLFHVSLNSEIGYLIQQNDLLGTGCDTRLYNVHDSALIFLINIIKPHFLYFIIMTFYSSFMHIKKPLKLRFMWITMCVLFIRDNL